MEQIDKRLSIIEDRYDRLDRCINGNGKPGIEERIMGQVKEMIRHERHNAEQIAVDVKSDLQEETRNRKEQTDTITRNQKEISDKQDKLELTIAKWGGAIAVATFSSTIIVGVVLHFWK